MDDQAPVRITFAQGTAAAVNRTFIGWFFAFAILFAGAAFYRPAIQAFAVGFPIYLVLWKLRLRGATRPGWALVVSRDALTREGGGSDRSIGKREVSRVRFEERRSQVQLVAFNREGKAVFRLPVDNGSRDRIVEALRAFDWPVAGPPAV
ncbi:MAG TPA: hypothetical protein VFV09_12220 [Actinomycetota bacterium]|jgi:hypothetical protein|nr:hypothetical protein [Actinomycetota bacterium]